MTALEQQLYEALKKYGRHSTPEHFCALNRHSEYACDCGLDFALSQFERQLEQETPKASY